MSFYNFCMYTKDLYNFLTGAQTHITSFGIAMAGEAIASKRNILICYIAKKKNDNTKYTVIVPHMNSLCLKLDKYIEPEK